MSFCLFAMLDTATKYTLQSVPQSLAVFFRYLVFGDRPDHWTLIGGSIVITSGLYVFARERARGISRPTPAPQD